MLRIYYPLVMLESKETNRNYLSSFVSRTPYHFAASAPAVMFLQAERPHGEMSPCWGLGTWLRAGCTRAWLSSLTVHASD